MTTSKTGADLVRDFVATATRVERDQGRARGQRREPSSPAAERTLAQAPIAGGWAVAA